MESIGDPAFEVEMSRQLLLGETLARNARKCPDTEGIIFKDRRISHRELDERVNRLANALLSTGIKMSDSIGLVMENRQEMVEIFFAAAKIGAVNVPVNTRLSPREMAYILNNADAKILLFSRKFSETIGKIKGELPLIEAYILIEEKREGDFQDHGPLQAAEACGIHIGFTTKCHW